MAYVVVVVAVFTGLRAVARRRWASSPGAEFWYTKSARAAGVRFYLHKLFRAGGIRFYLHKLFGRRGLSQCLGR